MKRTSAAITRCLVLSMCLLFIMAVSVEAEEYAVLKGLKSIKAVFDVRTGNPMSAAAQLGMIHEMYKDGNVRKITGKPEFVIIFIGPSVRLISTETEHFSPEEKETVKKITKTIKEMAKDGIKLEICLAAAKALGVNPASILPEIEHVGNGWFSLIGYQTRGYALVPAY